MFMTVFYNIVGVVNLVIAIMMLRCGALADEDRREFRLACKILHVIFVLTSFSMFAAQFEERLEYGEFQKLNPLMLLFFYLIGQGFIYTLLILFKAKYANRYIRHTIPVFSLFALYTVAYFIFGDPFIYSFDDFFASLPHSPMLMFRCVLTLSVLVSVVYGVVLCHRACRENNKRIADSFSESDFQRGVVISKFMWSVKALSVWSVLAYFYTTPPFEVVSCLLITIVLAFQFMGFRDYLLFRNSGALRVLTTSGEIDLETDGEKVELKRRLRSWAVREDKPFTQVSISIADVAKEIGVSKNKLSVYINSTDVNFRSWINNLRIEESKLLLAAKKEMPISEIAVCTGFCDLPAFSRAFKKATGISPKLFRNRSEVLPVGHPM